MAEKPRPLTARERRKMETWMRVRPRTLREALIRFPPGCTVRATRTLLCPAPGQVGTIYSYRESGTVTVVVDGNPTAGECELDWLELVESPEWSSDDVRKLLEEGSTS